MKKKIIIFSHAMEIGGAERSLLGLLEAIDPEQYDIDLFLMRHEGELLRYIPKYINVLPEKKEYTVLARPMKQTLLEGHLLLTAMRLYGKIAAYVFDYRHKYKKSEVALEYSHKYTKKFLPLIEPEVTYDLAVSFLTPHYYVAEKVKARKKVAWIHTDYSKIKIDTLSELKMWMQYDHIVSISDAVSRCFIDTFPSLRQKMVVIENILPECTINRQIGESQNVKAEMNEGDIVFLSIGRFCEAKNFDSIPILLRKIRSMGIDVHWYIIGFGQDEERIRDNMHKEGMEPYIHILGKTDNPYPYIKACDIYVQPSRYEGRCVTIREAQLLNKPVIITNYATSSSELECGIDGCIVPLEIDQCAREIVEIIKNRELLERMIRNCSSRDYTNKNQVEKLYDIIG